ncbi:MAG: hypothetical protein ACI9EF_001338, partial [Pseudohongiellaceae bacterium]
ATATDPALTNPVQVAWADMSVPGSPSGMVSSSPRRVFYGSVGWIMIAKFDGGPKGLFSEYAVAAIEGQALPGGLTLDTIWQSYDGNDEHVIVEAAVTSETDGFSAIVMDGDVLIAEGDAVLATGAAPGTVWLQHRAGIDLSQDNRLLLGAEIDDPTVTAPKETALLLYDVLPDGSLDNGEVILKTGDVFGGRVVKFVAGVTTATFERNEGGQIMHTLGFYDDDGVSSGNFAIVLDGVILAEDETTSVIPGRDWIVSVANSLDIAANGSWAFLSGIDGGGVGSSLLTLVHDGQLVALQGLSAPGLPGTSVTHIGPPKLADDGRMLWYAKWTENGSEREGLFVDDQLLVQENVTMVDDTVLTAISLGFADYDIHPDSSRLMFTGSHNQLTSYGAYEVPLAPWRNLGHSLLGSHVGFPYLRASGSLQAGSNTTIWLTRALPASTTFLVFGFSELGAPFKGGVLCPSPDIVFPGSPVDAFGTASVSASFPSGVPSGTDLFWQWWTVDGAAAAGFSASNCVVGTTP